MTRETVISLVISQMVIDEAMGYFQSKIDKAIDDSEYMTDEEFEFHKLAIEALEQMRELNLLLIQDDAHLMSVHHIKEKLGLLEVDKHPNIVNASDIKQEDECLVNDSQGFSQEPCEDAVSRQAVLDAYRRMIESGDPVAFRNEVEVLPPVSPARPKGKWIEVKNKNGTVVALKCNRCEKSPKRAIRSDFCPRCGSYNGGETDA